MDWFLFVFPTEDFSSPLNVVKLIKLLIVGLSHVNLNEQYYY